MCVGGGGRSLICRKSRWVRGGVRTHKNNTCARSAAPSVSSHFLNLFFISSLMCSHIHARTCVHEHRKAQSSHTCTPAPLNPRPQKTLHNIHLAQAKRTNAQEPSLRRPTQTLQPSSLSFSHTHTRARAHTPSTPPLFPALVNRVRIHKPPTSHPKHLPAKPYLSLSP